MSPFPRIIWALLLLTASDAFGASAVLAEWKDLRGATFRGEPGEALGPFALFRTGPTTGKALPWSALSDADCARFYQAVANQPAAGTHWSEATGRITKELMGKMERVSPDGVSKPDLYGVPEPELLIVFAALGVWRDGYRLEDLAPFSRRVRQVYGGRVETVLVAPVAGPLPLRHTWLFVDLRSHYKSLKELAPYMPKEGTLATLMTRDGWPLLSMPITSSASLRNFLDAATGFLAQLNPANALTARERIRYLNVVRAAQFSMGKTGPLPVGEFLRPDRLRASGVVRIEAKMEVTADGSVAQVTMLPASEMPAALQPAIGGALRRSAVFAPAVENGRAVASVFDYSLTLEPMTPQLAADTAWAGGAAREDVALPHWLVLKPIRIDEKVFVAVDHVAKDGTVMLKPVTAGNNLELPAKVQLNSFVTDWFAGDGAGSVRPRLGQQQVVDGEKLTWKTVKADEGYVELLERSREFRYDYCIAYAWAEIEWPDERDAWLAIGSDDGLKVWFNGELVNDHWVARTSRLDDDVVAVHLKPGKNAILIKIQNVKGEWTFTARLRARAK